MVGGSAVDGQNLLFEAYLTSERTSWEPTNNMNNSLSPFELVISRPGRSEVLGSSLVAVNTLTIGLTRR